LHAHSASEKPSVEVQPQYLIAANIGCLLLLFVIREYRAATVLYQGFIDEISQLMPI